MKDSYILGFRATVGFSPKNATKLWSVCNKHQILLLIIKFEKLNKLRYSIQNYLRSSSPEEALSSWALILIPKTKHSTTKKTKKKEKIKDY